MLVGEYKVNSPAIPLGLRRTARGDRAAMTTIPEPPHWGRPPPGPRGCLVFPRVSAWRGARCSAIMFRVGWELRLLVGELVRSQVCRGAEEILAMQEE